MSTFDVVRGAPRLFTGVSIKSDASGNFNSGGIAQVIRATTGRIGPPGPGNAWTFSLQAPMAPVGAIFTAYVADFPWCSWGGSAPSPLIQIFGTEHCDIVATGLAVNTGYQINLIGVETAQELATPVVPASGTVNVGGIVNVAGTVNVQSQQRFLGSFTPAGANGSFTVTGLLPSDQFLWFVFDPSQAGADPVWLLITGTTNTNQTYGSIPVTVQTPDFVPCLPLVDNQVRVAYTTLISGTNPIGIKVYASPTAPTRIPKLLGAQHFQGALTASQTITLLGANAVARLKHVALTMNESAATGPAQIHFDYRTFDNAAHSIYLNVGQSATGASTDGTISVDMHDTLITGSTGVNAAQLVGDNGISLAACTMLYEDLRGK